MISFWNNFYFASPWWLVLLIIVPIMVWWYYFSGKKTESRIVVSSLEGLPAAKSIRERMLPYLPVLNIAAVALMIIAMARPQLMLKEEKVKADGIDIMMAMDLSSSMLSRDFNPDRLEVSKMVAKEFVSKRNYDRIGLVVFAGEAFTQCPLTVDHNILQNFLSELQVGMMEDGTAIGMGLATAVNRLKDSKAKSKIIILLTDGVNNAGYINPNTAAEIAKQYGVKVYTIAVGSMGEALSPVNRTIDGEYFFAMSKVEIDTELLKSISMMTGGKYFRAIDRESLENIYTEIDKLEKTEIEVNVFKRYKDEYRGLLYWALGLLISGFLLQNTIFRKIN
ncbi:MAG: VWA domain-containing protein [Saprospiraceae bacterium]|nr:MAG: von Willebrand factor A [Bacteroidetes bacterium OLB9]MCO6463761.1 VWA domain-containing protein [Saprospiraceae bacterium]MCZ2338603.1 VWA domain-containing protein [Chitinophagales bacterium]